MKDSKEYSRKVQKLYRSLKRKYPKPQKVIYEEPLEALVYAVISENMPGKAAQSAMKRISDNLRLVSFELISRELDDPSSTEILEKRKLIEKILNTEDKVSCNALKKALERHQVYLEESSLDFLYL